MIGVTAGQAGHGVGPGGVGAGVVARSCLHGGARQAVSRHHRGGRGSQVSVTDMVAEGAGARNLISGYQTDTVPLGDKAPSLTTAGIEETAIIVVSSAILLYMKRVTPWAAPVACE